MSESKYRLTVIFSLIALVLLSGTVMMLISVAVPESQNPGALVTQFLALVTPTVGVLLLIINSDKNRDTVKGIDSKVDKVLNGVMDEKIQTNLRAVLDERESSNG